MTITVTQLHPHIGAEIGGIDLRQPVDAATVGALWQAIDRHAVLVFHEQQLSDEELRGFAAHFGVLEIGRSAARWRPAAPPNSRDSATSRNLDEDNRSARLRDDRRRLDSLGNRLWHTDASYMPVPVVLGMLFAVKVPPPSPFGAGETEFADMRAAYDALSDAQKAAIDGLVVEHDVFWSRGQIGFTEFPPGERDQYKPVAPKRLVRRHPRLGAQDLVSVGARVTRCRLADPRRSAPPCMI